jgi:hypothetical protein
MTTQASTEDRQQVRRAVRTQVIMTAVTLAVISLVVLRQVNRRGDESALTVAGGTTRSTVAGGVAPMGGLAELYQEEQRALAAREAAGVSTRARFAEAHAGQAARAPAATPTVYIVESAVRAAAARQTGGVARLR